MTLHVQTDRTLVRTAGRSVRYVLLSFAAPEARHASVRDPINVTFVIDRSGSMGGSKIRLAREAVVQALRMLKATDRFSVIAYDHEVDVLVPSTLAGSEALRNAVSQVEGLQARGNTDLGAGWLQGCEQLATWHQPGQTARCLLLSDGLANHGITSRAELARHAAELRERGITTSTMGLGADFDEHMLEGLSTAGAGHFYYIDAPVQIADCLTGELGEALEVVAHDATVSILASDGLKVTTLNRFHVQEDGAGRFSVRVGDLVSRQELSLVVRLEFPAGADGRTARAVFGVSDARGALDERDTDILWTFADPPANDTQPRNLVVDRAVAALYAAQAQAEALVLNRAGNFTAAKARLEATRRRIGQYAGDDAALRKIVERLEERDAVYAMPMSAVRSKSEHFQSLNIARMRKADGSARRRSTP